MYFFQVTLKRFLYVVFMYVLSTEKLGYLDS